MNMSYLQKNTRCFLFFSPENTIFSISIISHTFLQLIIRSQKHHLNLRICHCPLLFCAHNEISFAFATRHSHSYLKEGGWDLNSQKYHTVLRHLSSSNARMRACCLQTTRKLKQRPFLPTTLLFSINIIELAHPGLNPKTHRFSTVCHALLRVFHGLANYGLENTMFSKNNVFGWGCMFSTGFYGLFTGFYGFCASFCGYIRQDPAPFSRKNSQQVSPGLVFAPKGASGFQHPVQTGFGMTWRQSSGACCGEGN